MKKIKSIWYRLYSDYITKNRYNEYEIILETIRKKNYESICISEYTKLAKKGRHVIIRHDIDTDVPIAKKLFELEKQHGIKATYFFRLSTIDIDFIKELISNGYEVGYHYEEIATYAKQHKIKTRNEIEKHMGEIQQLFRSNIEAFEKQIGTHITSIASHGDHANRKLDMPNNFLFNVDLQKEYPNIIEAYDERIEGKLDARISDTMPPTYWKPIGIDEVFSNNPHNFLMLVHPRWWNKAPLIRFKETLRRIIEGIEYR